jgi:hypothetical protein
MAGDVLRMNFCGVNPPLRQAAHRYLNSKTRPHKKNIPANFIYFARENSQNKKLMRKIFPVIIISMLAFNAGGFLLLFEIEQQGIHRAMEEIIRYAEKSASLENITLSRREYESSKTDEYEIRFRGKMYDIARIEFHNDSVTIYCINDTEEENLFVALEKIFSPQKQHSSKQQSQVPHQFVKFLSLAFLQTENFSSTCIDFTKSMPQQHTMYFPEIFPAYAAPPPKF